MSDDSKTPSFSIEMLNKLLGTNFESLESMTDHEMLAVLVCLMAAQLDVQIFNCRIKDEPDGNET
jgi:hypothetical protein